MVEPGAIAIRWPLEVVEGVLRVAGDAMDKAIIQYLLQTYNLFVGPHAAEEIRIKLGSAYPLNQELETTVKGRDMIEYLGRKVQITSEEIREALADTTQQIVHAIKEVLEDPELCEDLVERGIVLSGGGGLLRGLDELIRKETGLLVRIQDGAQADSSPTLIEWYVRAGESIHKDQELLLVGRGTSLHPLTSPVDGTLLVQWSDAGEPVGAGETLGWIRPDTPQADSG